MKRNSGNVLVVVISFLAILAIVAIGYFYWSSKTRIPTMTENKTLFPMSTPSDELTPEVAKRILPLPDPTANWKTYTNAEYNFSFEYPSEFKYVVENEVFTDGDYNGVVIVQNFPRTNQPNYSNSATFQMLIYVKKDQGEVIGQDTMTLVSGGPGAFTNFVKNGYIYHVYMTLNKTGNAKLFSQILSTFKFL